MCSPLTISVQYIQLANGHRTTYPFCYLLSLHLTYCNVSFVLLSVFILCWFHSEIPVRHNINYCT